MTITRTIELADITPTEIAELFCEMDGEQQADFFRMVGFIAKSWPGAGWCQQAYAIAQSVEVTGRATIEKLAEHVLGYDELVAALRNLAGNVGALRAFEHEIREVAGNTNWQCLMDAVEAADETLKAKDAHHVG